MRLLDPCWGDQVTNSKRGQEDTFHFTNAAPQVQKYNDSDWGNLEDYLLAKAQGTEKKLTVFTGPIYLPNDHRSFQASSISEDQSPLSGNAEEIPNQPGHWNQQIRCRDRLNTMFAASREIQPGRETEAMLIKIIRTQIAAIIVCLPLDVFG